MAANQKTIFVYDDFSSEQPVLMGSLFILAENGWILSPLYDVNPVPYGDELSLMWMKRITASVLILLYRQLSDLELMRTMQRIMQKIF